MADVLRPQWVPVLIGVLVGLVWTAAKVSIPLLVRSAIDHGIVTDDSAALRRWAFVIAVVGIIQGTFTGLRRWWAFRVARWSETTLRDRLFAHLQRLHFAYHDNAQTGNLMSRANTDLNQVQQFLVMIPLTLSNAVTVAAVTVILVTIDPVLTLLALGSLPLLNVFAKRFGVRLHPPVMGIQRESADVAAVVEETVSGVRVVKGFGAERVQQASFQHEVDQLYDAVHRGDPGPVDLPARARDVAQHRAHPRAGVRRPSGDQREPLARLAGGLQRLRGDAHLAVAHARHDPRPGAARRRVEPAGARGARGRAPGRRRAPPDQAAGANRWLSDR